tara:strand:- start:215 stop:421 length:207 start_codon:yes stop_codon:yes gene_type:complete
MRIYLRKNKEAYDRGRNDKTSTNNPLWQDIVVLNGKKFLFKAWPFNTKWGKQDLLINMEVYGQDKEEG